MTTDELRAAAGELVHLHQRFAPYFGRKEARAQSLVYLNGLLLGQERKSAEPMALTFGQPGDEGLGQNQVLALQRFLTVSPWDYQGALGLQRRRQAAPVGRERADWWIGLTDGGNGLDDCGLQHFARSPVLILAFYHPAEKLFAWARLGQPRDAEQA